MYSLCVCSKRPTQDFNVCVCVCVCVFVCVCMCVHVRVLWQRPTQDFAGVGVQPEDGHGQGDAEADVVAGVLQGGAL